MINTNVTLSLTASLVNWNDKLAKVVKLFDAFEPILKAHRVNVSRIHSDYRRKKGGRW